MGSVNCLNVSRSVLDMSGILGLFHWGIVLDKSKCLLKIVCDGTFSDYDLVADKFNEGRQQLGTNSKLLTILYSRIRCACFLCCWSDGQFNSWSISVIMVVSVPGLI